MISYSATFFCSIIASLSNMSSYYIIYNILLILCEQTLIRCGYSANDMKKEQIRLMGSNCNYFYCYTVQYQIVIVTVLRERAYINTIYCVYLMQSRLTSSSSSSIALICEKKIQFRKLQKKEENAESLEIY